MKNSKNTVRRVKEEKKLLPRNHKMSECVVFAMFKANRVQICSVFSITTNEIYVYKSVLFKCCLISNRSHTSFPRIISKHIQKASIL